VKPDDEEDMVTVTRVIANGDIEYNKESLKNFEVSKETRDTLYENLGKALRMV